MGGGSYQIEPDRCEEFKSKSEVWCIIEKGKIATHVEGMKGSNPKLSQKIVEPWEGEKVAIRSVSFLVALEPISFCGCYKFECGGF